MRVVVQCDWFMERMGYSDNLLSKALAALGVEVHVVSSDIYLQVERNMAAVYSGFLGKYAAGSVQTVNGFTLHRLGHAFNKEGVWINGLMGKVRELKPDIVQTIKPIGWNALRLAYHRDSLGYKLFAEEHTHWSVFKLHPAWKRRMYQLWYGQLAGRYFNGKMERCYAIGPDCAEIAVQYYGIGKEKVVVQSLGYDDQVFSPIETDVAQQQRVALRTKLGIGTDELLVIYTGRFTAGKNPLCLVQAVHQLRAQGLPYRALLIGWGDEAYMRELNQYGEAVIVHPFVEWHELAAFYQAADVACWPKQESTSQLDAAACGLPLVVSAEIGVRDRVEGNALFYRENDAKDLAKELAKLQAPALREEMGRRGAKKMKTEYSWRSIAQKRIADYEQSLRKK